MIASIMQKARCRAAQSIASSWALNEEYFYNDDGHLDNSSYLDYRIPTTLDLPMIEKIIIEIPRIPVIPIECVASAKSISRHCSRCWPCARKNHR